MKVKANYAVVVEMEVDDKFEILTAEADNSLMNELEEVVIKNSPFEKVKVAEGYVPLNDREYMLIGVYSADDDLAMLEY